MTSKIPGRLNSPFLNSSAASSPTASPSKGVVDPKPRGKLPIPAQFDQAAQAQSSPAPLSKPGTPTKEPASPAALAALRMRKSTVSEGMPGLPMAALQKQISKQIATEIEVRREVPQTINNIEKHIIPEMSKLQVEADSTLKNPKPTLEQITGVLDKSAAVLQAATPSLIVLENAQGSGVRVPPKAKETKESLVDSINQLTSKVGEFMQEGSSAYAVIEAVDPETTEGSALSNAFEVYEKHSTQASGVANMDSSIKAAEDALQAYESNPNSDQAASTLSELNKSMNIIAAASSTISSSRAILPNAPKSPFAKKMDALRAKQNLMTAGFISKPAVQKLIEAEPTIQEQIGQMEEAKTAITQALDPSEEVIARARPKLSEAEKCILAVSKEMPSILKKEEKDLTENEREILKHWNELEIDQNTPEDIISQIQTKEGEIRMLECLDIALKDPNVPEAAKVGFPSFVDNIINTLREVQPKLKPLFSLVNKTKLKEGEIHKFDLPDTLRLNISEQTRLAHLFLQCIEFYDTAIGVNLKAAKVPGTTLAEVNIVKEKQFEGLFGVYGVVRDCFVNTFSEFHKTNLLDLVSKDEMTKTSEECYKGWDKFAETRFLMFKLGDIAGLEHLDRLSKAEDDSQLNEICNSYISQIKQCAQQATIKDFDLLEALIVYCNENSVPELIKDCKLTYLNKIAPQVSDEMLQQLKLRVEAGNESAWFVLLELSKSKYPEFNKKVNVHIAELEKQA